MQAAAVVVEGVMVENKPKWQMMVNSCKSQGFKQLDKTYRGRRAAVARWRRSNLNRDGK